MIRGKRVYEKPAKGDGFRVLVDRLWPRGLTKDASHVDAWMKEVAPSGTLRQWFAHDARKWGEFQKRYRAELAGSRGKLQELLRIENQHGTLTLLFGARDEAHNQAVVLANALKEQRK